jgi:hypothetical protein
MLEASLRAPFTPETAFTLCAQRPAPGFATMVLNLLLWTGAAVLVNALMLLSSGASSSLGIVWTVISLAASLALSLAASFMGAGILLALAALSGGEASYERSYELSSLLSSLAPAACALAWLSVPWWSVLMSVYAAWLMIAGIAALHRAPKLQAGMVVGGFALVLIGAQILARPLFQRLSRQAETAAQLYTAEQSAVQALSQLQAAAQQQPAAPSADPSQPAQDPAAATPMRGLSSVDMIRSMNSADDGSAGSGLRVPPALPDPREMERMKESGLEMLETASRRMNDPALMRSLSPEQARQMKGLQRAVDQLRGQMKNGQPIDNRQMLSQILQIMSQVQQSPAPDRRGAPPQAADGQ